MFLSRWFCLTDRNLLGFLRSSTILPLSKDAQLTLGFKVRRGHLGSSADKNDPKNLPIDLWICCFMGM